MTTTSSHDGYDIDQFRADHDAHGFTATSYAVLGLLALREWTTYELAQQMKRSFSYFWPRAERRIYDEPKRLAQAGYALPRREVVGRRPRTCWTITERGREALRHWLGEPLSTPLTMEFEGMLKVFLCENGSKKQLLQTLDAIRADAVARREQLAAMSAEIVTDTGRFPEREHINALTMEYMVQVSELTARWAEEAAGLAAGWRSTASPGPAARDAAREAFVRFAGDQRPK
jgi:DNA-binding PadR family transcriptional regulator